MGFRSKGNEWEKCEIESENRIDLFVSGKHSARKKLENCAQATRIKQNAHTHTHCIDNDARKILNVLTVHRNAVAHFTVRSVDLIILPPIEILGKFYFVVVRSSMWPNYHATTSHKTTIFICVFVCMFCFCSEKRFR